MVNSCYRDTKIAVSPSTKIESPQVAMLSTPNPFNFPPPMSSSK